MVRKRAIVTGSVQGVGFRWSARETAHRLGVTGFARNRADGSVEVEVEGDQEPVDRMLDWLRTGPPGSEVADVAVSDAAPAGDDAFRIRETR
ncbi:MULTISPECIES: acylphosphatase [unclassified Leifsonia]|uniref:acylphosphatase n=1 Tax=unclassified Leifsonia TaxID=2663824 RepID=UPI000A19432D|nr:MULTISPECIES: acylphosphatase [unclassified Leifsonia]QIZ99345.1 acylphosphatase [Leifsonia sp. PS1209]